VRHVAQAYHRHYGGSVVFFSDLEGFLVEEETSWRERRTEPRAAVDQLLNGDLAVPSLLLLVSRYAHGILSLNPRAPVLRAADARDADAAAGGHGAPVSGWRREAVRQAIALQLAVDWPAHVRRLAEEGRLEPRVSPAPAAAGDQRIGEAGCGPVGDAAALPRRD
jgi:hypothetical protein